MHGTRLLGTIGVSLWVAAAATATQGTSAPALSKDLRKHLQDERFEIVTSIRGLPLGVRESLQTLFGSHSLDIAEPDGDFQMTDAAVDPKRPSRRMVAAGCSHDHCLVYYERGGGSHTWHVALFQWTPAATRFEWGGVAPGGLSGIQDVRKAILSDVIKGRAGVW